LGLGFDEVVGCELRTRSPYATDVNDEKWVFAAPYVTLLPGGVSRRKCPPRGIQ